MGNSLYRQVGGLVALSVLGLLIFTGLYYATAPAGDAGRQIAHGGEHAVDATLVAPDAERFDLGRDHTVQIGEARVTYRGLDPQRRLRIDVVIPALDPQVTYPYRIPFSQARAGFRLASRDFRLLSADRHRVRLRPSS